MPLSTTWLSKTLLPVSAAPLGRLVADVTDPEADFQDTSLSTERPDGPKVTATELRKEQFSHNAAASRSSSLAVAATSILSSTLSFDRDEITSITADAYTQRRLSDPVGYFELACCTCDVRAWLEQHWRRRRRAYIVVGVMILHNSRITLCSHKDCVIGQSTGLSGSVVLQAATHGMVATLGGLENILDSEVAISRDDGKTTASSFTVPGDSILAVLYQRVHFSWFRNPSSRSKPALLKAGAKWEAYLGGRGECSDAESDNGGVGDEDEDGDIITDHVNLQAKVNCGVDSDDLGEFDEYEEFVLGDNEELWHIST